MDLEEIWRDKPDAVVRAAASSLKDYTPEARAVIKAEFERRQMGEGPTEQEEALAEPDPRMIGAATLGDRFTARFIDNVVIVVPLGIVFGFFELNDLLGLINFVIVLGFVFLYSLFADALPGGSLGKRCVGIAVVTYDTRERCTVWRSFFRNVLPMLGLSGLDVIFIFGKTRRRLGDMIAGTMVIKLDD
jgi:uncharacterized RDD family membrane protein YckC